MDLLGDFNREKRDEIINKIMEMIHDENLKQGDVINPERKLAKKLNISRGKLRESLKVLEKLGIIKTKAGSGRYLNNISIKRTHTNLKVLESLEEAAMYDLLEARECIECKILELVIQKASDDEIKNIEKKLNDHDDNSFHLKLAKASKNVILYNFMLINLELLLEASKGIIQTSPKRKEIMVLEHQEILDAIKNKDVAKAKLYLYRHLRNVRDAI